MTLLKEMGCHKTQGYLHCPPVPAAQLERLLANPSLIASMRKTP
jgi:EAL domain-containing protein (putative c-di-GMP-specific phosphodiesterase class I)